MFLIILMEFALHTFVFCFFNKAYYSYIKFLLFQININTEDGLGNNLKRLFFNCVQYNVYYNTGSVIFIRSNIIRV